ncbi:MAG: 4-hydroxy-3-methylbut-2-enyl diphosphate reductase, partial [Hungatella sp.]
MQVTVAKTAGFCFGVRRAVEQVYEQIESGS